MRHQRAVYPRFGFGGVINHAGRDHEIIRLPTSLFPLILEPSVRPAAAEVDGKIAWRNSELDLIWIAPTVAQRVNVNRLALHHLALQRFAVTNERAGLRVMILDRSRNRRRCVTEVLPRFAE